VAIPTMTLSVDDRVLICKEDHVDETIEPKENLNIIEHDHSYPLPNQKGLKRKLDISEDKCERLQKKVKHLSRKEKVLTDKVSSLNEVIDTLKQKNLVSDYIRDILEEASCKVPAEMIERLLKNKSKNQTCRTPYSEEMKTFAVTLQFYSSKAYNFVRQTFNLGLPHESVVRKWYSSINAEPGFSEQSFETLKTKVEEDCLKNKDVFVFITFDEMAIKKKLEFDGQNFVGYVDYGKCY
jgi:hypothetical protein